MAQSKPAFPYLALLRGINVGGRNKLAMKDLSRLFIEAGCSDVRTYIQSGNVLFNAPGSAVRRIPEHVAESTAGEIGSRIPVVLRTFEELGDVIRNNPFLAEGLPRQTLHVSFLAATPAEGAVAALDPNRSAPDRFLVQGREIYLQMPNGMARTKLTSAYFDSRLATIGTARNWNTVLQLHALMQG